MPDAHPKELIILNRKRIFLQFVRDSIFALNKLTFYQSVS